MHRQPLVCPPGRVSILVRLLDLEGVLLIFFVDAAEDFLILATPVKVRVVLHLDIGRLRLRFKPVLVEVLLFLSPNLPFRYRESFLRFEPRSRSSKGDRFL